MVQRYRLYLFLACMSALFSCEKVVDLKLGNTPPKLVIEATLTDRLTQQFVYLSTTMNFDSETAKVPVSNGVVTLKDENGTSITFVEQSPGTYRSNRFRGIAGRKYTLSVQVKGTTYTASSVMAAPVPITNLNQAELSFFGEIQKGIEVNYKDPVDAVNFYSSRVFVNGVKRDQLFVDSDRFTNGRDVRNLLFVDEPFLKEGDDVTVQLLTIDAAVYRYLFSITQIGGNGGPPTAPANPVSNFNNGALGYFSASAVTEAAMKVR